MLFICPSFAYKSRYLSLKYLWDIGPDLLPNDTMHLFLRNDVPKFWGLFFGENKKLDNDQPCVIPKAIREYIGREMKTTRKTIPFSQARSLRNIHKHSSSYKAVDWMYFLSCISEAVLPDIIPESFFKMFLLLCRAGRLIFRPGVSTAADLRKVDKLLRHFCQAFYEHV